MEFDVPIGTAGDTYDRYLVRLEEFRQSLRIIRQAIEGLPEGPIVGKVPRLIKPPAGETYHAIESPKGELGYFIVSDGKSTQPVSLPRAAAVVLQPAGAAAADHGASGGRRRRADRLDRHRARRSGSMIDWLRHSAAQDPGRAERDAGRGHLHGAARAQGDRLGAVAARADARRPVRHPAAGRRRVKLMIKEDITPARADKWVFTAAPIIVDGAGADRRTR